MKRQGCDVLVVGGGPAGILAAYHAAKAGATVILVDVRPVPGEKIALSGGGRCNILPTLSAPEDYTTSSSRHTMRKILLSWPLDEVRVFLESVAGIRLVEQKRTGRVFPAAGGGEGVRERLLVMLRRSGVRLIPQTKVVDIEPDERRRVRVESGPGFVAERVVLATGGLSYPRTGCDGLGFRVAERLGHAVVSPYPALVPLRGAESRHAVLAGIALRARLDAGSGRERQVFEGDFLFTHAGYSGPVVMNAAHHASRTQDGPRRAPLRVAWLARDAEEWDAVLSSSRGTLRGALKAQLPDRWVDVLLKELGLWGAEMGTLNGLDRARVLSALSAYELPWMRAGGYGEAEVTGGGVALSDVDVKTLQSRKVPCLYFCGETLDAFGPIGGHNFLWAFVTGRLAGRGAAAS
ncbi:MAG: aminoacetone oxidase family FAD-binding enzyme [Candidatus Bipolaricaulota bacterium]